MLPPDEGRSTTEEDAMADVSAAPRTGGLSRGLRAFLVVDVILVLTFLGILVAQGLGGTQEPEAAPPAVTTDPEPETSPGGSAPASPDASESLSVFVLPSGNIWCSMDGTTATCTILEFSYDAPEVPEGCTGTVGHVLQVTAGEEAGFACVEGEVPGPPADAPVLEYGEGSTVGEMTCLSSRNGAFCRHNPSGAGFSLARAGTQFF